MRGIFGDLFDFDGNGELDAMERAADFGMFMEMLEEDEREASDDNFEDEF